MSKSVEQFYDSQSEEEWERLLIHKIEYEQTRMALDEFISKSSRILDVGGGPGRYSFYLASKGHLVSLLDLSCGNIEMAKEKSREMSIELEAIHQGNALDLSQYTDEEFDVVLLT